MNIKRQFLWSMAPLLVVTAMNVFSVRLFLKYLGTDMYALWFYVSSFSGAFGFMDLGLGVAVGRYIGVALGAKDMAAVRQYWGTGNLIVIPLLGVMALVFIVAGAVGGPAWFHVSPDHVGMLRLAFIIGGFSLFISYYTQFWLVLSQAYLDFKFIGVVRSAASIIQLPLSVWLAYLTRNPVVIICASLILGGIQLLLFASHGIRHYHLGLNLRDATMARAREMSGYVSKTFGSLMAGSFLGSLDRLILGKIAPPADFAHYVVDSNFGTRIQGLSGAIMGPVFHQTNRVVAKGGRESAAAIYNETFDFTFGWYALIAIWTVCWYPIFLRLWLGADIAHGVAPAFAPIVTGCCLSAIASISTAQLASLNRVGIEMGFNIVNGLFRGFCVAAGWHWFGFAGAGWGFLLSRVVTLTQDIYAIRIIRGGGWLARRTWVHLLAQVAIGGAAATAYLFLSRESLWMVVPAVLHGGLVATWLLRGPLRRFIGSLSFFSRFRRDPVAAPLQPEL